MNRANIERIEAPVRFARFLAVLGVASSLLLAAVLFLAAFARAVLLAVASVRGLGREDTLEHLIVAAVAHADALLIATALLIVGIGLYSIFIGRVERLPAWLAITGIDDLKDKLAGVVVVALAVRFFTVALEWSGSGDILGYGLAIAAVVAAVTAYTGFGHGREKAAPRAATGDAGRSAADAGEEHSPG